MTHPSQSTLALYAGKDLGWWARRRTERHLSNCRECRAEVDAFASLPDELVDLEEMPALPWSRLAAEMKANIRLGLAAGECVRGEKSGEPVSWFSGGRAVVACAGIMALLAMGLLLERPAPPVPPVMARQGSLLRATAGGIELDQGGQSLSLLHIRAGDVTYSAGAQGSMRARYVDSDTGNVTINNVYVQ